MAGAIPPPPVLGMSAGGCHHVQPLTQTCRGIEVKLPERQQHIFVQEALGSTAMFHATVRQDGGSAAM